MTTALPAIEPKGLGTDMVESLTSYVRRLAAMLRVSNTALVGWLAPGSNPSTYTEAVNGTERAGAQIAGALIRATGLASIAGLGLAASRGLHLRRDFSPIRRWCSVCLDGGEGYDALVTTLRATSSCPLHGTPLLSECARGHAQRTWASWARPGQCAECGEPLCVSTPKVSTPDDFSEAAASIIRWTQEGKSVEPPRIAAWMRTRRGVSPLARCADHFGWHFTTVANIEGGAQRLQFSTLTTLLVRGNTTIAEIHQPDPVQVKSQVVGKNAVIPRLNVEPLRRAVIAELSKPVSERRGLRRLARSLRVSHITLRRHVPETDELVSDWQAAAARQGKAP